MNFTVRFANPSDVAILTAFNRAMALETENKQLDLKTVTRGISTLLSQPSKGKYLVACDEGGRVIGQLMHTFEWSDWRAGDVWWIQSVYVMPEYRRKGVYTMLHNHLRDLASKTPGVVGIRLYVENDNTRAQTTYKNVGMKPAGYFVMEDMFVEI